MTTKSREQEVFELRFDQAIAPYIQLLQNLTDISVSQCSQANQMFVKLVKLEQRIDDFLQEQADLVAKQQQQIKTLQETTKTLTAQLNKLDRHQHHQNQSMY
jgi:hypothetical protein